jgi:hypothetical protein
LKVQVFRDERLRRVFQGTSRVLRMVGAIRRYNLRRVALSPPFANAVSVQLASISDWKLADVLGFSKEI